MIVGFKNVFFAVIVTAIFLMAGASYSLDRNNIDVVLVMDNSGSMKKTDPLTLRIPAAKLFISLLDENDRAGVITFSDLGYPVAYLTHVDSEVNKDRLLRAIEKVSSKGLYTNLYDALNIGLDVLSRDKRSGRVQIIVLMSDGKMDLGNPDEDKRLVNILKNDLLGILKNNGIQVYTIAFSELSDRQLLEEISKETGGFYNLTLSDKNLHMIFTSIFENLKAPEMLPLDKNRFFVDKSIEEVTIVATKVSSDTNIYLKSPDGKKYSSKEKGNYIRWFVSHNFDMITVKRPDEGNWEILFSTGKDNKVYIITNLKLQTNFEKLYHTSGEHVDIEVWLEKDGTILNEEEILEKINIYIEVSYPDDEAMRLMPINKDEKVEGIFTSQFVPDKTGYYRLRIVAKGETFEREKTFTFNVLKPAVVQKEETVQEEDTVQEEKKIEQPHEETDTLSWKKVLIIFVSIHMVCFIMIVVFIYFKRKDIIQSLTQWAQSLVKRGGDN